MYFNYHAKVKKLIRSGEATGFDFIESYHGISPCMVIYFKHNRPMPIREHRFDEYLALLREYGIY